jgi:hypothetical protein
MSHNKDTNKGENEDANENKNNDIPMDQNDEDVANSDAGDEHDKPTTSTAIKEESGIEQPDEKSGDMYS